MVTPLPNVNLKVTLALDAAETAAKYVKQMYGNVQIVMEAIALHTKAVQFINLK